MKDKAIKQLEKLFGRSADGDTIYACHKITQDEEIEINNICYENDVDFALGTTHVTIFDKGETK